jgi:large repetitive protein
MRRLFASAVLAILSSTPVFAAAPVVANDSYTTAEETVLIVPAATGLLANDADADGDAMTPILSSKPASGRVVIRGDGGLTYTPAIDFNGTVTFQYYVWSDFTRSATPATVTIEVTPVNDVPVAVDDAYYVAVNSSFDSTLPPRFNDDERESLIDVDAVLLSNASAGTLVSFTTSHLGVGGATYFEYASGSTPGRTTFTYNLIDNSGVPSNAATVTIGIGRPVVGSSRLTTPRTSPLTAAFPIPAASPFKHDAGSAVNVITFEVVDAPPAAEGSVSLSGGGFTFTPNPAFRGVTSFTYRGVWVAGASVTNTGRITIIVIDPTVVEAAPVALQENTPGYTTSEDTPLIVGANAGLLVNDTDANGDPLYAMLLEPAARGTVVVGLDGSFHYTPLENFSGTDEIAYLVLDGATAYSNQTAVAALMDGRAYAALQIDGVNDAPVAVNDAYEILEGETLETADSTIPPQFFPDARGVLENDHDVEDQYSMRIDSIADQPDHGTLELTPLSRGGFTYTPDSGYSGTDSFTYRVKDAFETGNTAVVTITISPVNDPPAVVQPSLTPSTTEETATPPMTIAEGTAFQVSDADDTELAYVRLTPTGPFPEFPGSFTFPMTSMALEVEAGTNVVTIRGAGGASAPIASFNSVFDGMTFTPGKDHLAGFSVEVSDGKDTTYDFVNVTVANTNDPPGLQTAPTNVDENTPNGSVVTGVGVSPSEPDEVYAFEIIGGNTGDAFSIDPSGGAISVADETVLDFETNPRFDLEIRVTDTTTADPALNSGTGVLTIFLNNVDEEGNDRPIADAQSVSTDEDTPIGVTLTGSDIDGDTLSFSIIDAPSNGSLAGDPPELTYTPGSDFHGTDTFVFSVHDGTEMVEATVTIEVAPVADPPQANGSTVITPEDVPVLLTLDAHDGDGGELLIDITTEPAHGTLTGTGVDLTYTPDLNYNGADSFFFTASDGTSTTAAVEVVITVAPINDPPVAAAQNVSLDEDAFLGITLDSTRPDGESVTFEITVPPQHGALSGSVPNLSYTPEANYHGADSFTFSASDGTLHTTAVVSITVNDINDAPVPNAPQVATDEDTPVAVTLNATDADGGTPSFAIAQQPSHGTLSGDAPNLTYTPDPNYFGTDSFEFTASDGTATVPATVSININAVADPPMAAAQNVSTNEDAPLGIVLSGSDGDNDALTYSIDTPPSHGTLSGDAPNVTYTPAPNYHGSDSFTFSASDGKGSDAAVISIVVEARDDLPVADVQSVATNEDAALPIALTASDADGDTIAYAITSPPSHGTFASGIYTPDANYHGSDSFVFTATAGAASDSATISITIEPVADNPVAHAQSLGTNEDTPLAIVLSGSDGDGDALTYAIATPPAHGTFADGLYTPNANYAGADSFTFTATAGGVTSPPATISIGIAPLNDAPVAHAQSLSTNEDTPLPIVLSGSDVENEALSYQVVAGPSHGTFTGGTYTPAANYFGSDSFTFSVTDGESEPVTAVISIEIEAVNDAPVAHAQSVGTNEDTPLAIELTGSDAEDDALAYAIVSAPSHGTFAGGTYTPDANYHGSDSFTFSVTDGASAPVTAIVSIEIESVNDAPVANAQLVDTDEDTPLAIELTGSDVENDALTYAIVSAPSHGTFAAGSYTPNANYHGSDSFTFSVSDGASAPVTAVVSIDIESVNDVPVANAQPVATDEDTPLAIELTGSDADNDALTYAVVSAPSHGTFAAGTYTPNANYFGSDSFTFSVTDGLSAPVTAVVSIDIASVNDAPVANAQALGTDEDTPLAIELTGSDVENDALTYAIVTAPSHGTFAAGTYTPDANYFGSDSFTFSVTDGASAPVQAVVSIEIAAVNDAPVLSGPSAQTAVAGAVIGPLAFTVSDPDSATVAVTATSSDLAVIRNLDLTVGANTITIASRSDAYGTATITLAANDALATTTFSFTVTLTQTLQPATANVHGGARICAGASTQITADLTGGAPWRVIWSDGHEQTSASSRIDREVSPSATTTYSIVTVTDANGTGAASGTAVITVDALPDVPVIAGATAIQLGGTLTLTVAPGQLTYQWFRNGAVIEQATASVFTIDAVTSGDAGEYHVVVSNERCTATSARVRVTIGDEAFVPVIGATAGAFGAEFKTSMQLANLTGEEIAGELSFVDSGIGANAVAQKLPYTLAPFAVRAIDDVMRDLGRTGLGTLDLLPSAGGAPLVLARVFNDAGALGTSGMTLRDMLRSQALRAGQRGVFIAPEDRGTFRMNVGLRTFSSDAVVRITTRDAAGSARNVVERRFGARGLAQMSAAAFTGIELLDSDSITIEVLEGEALFYASRVHNGTNDSTIQFATAIAATPEAERQVIAAAGTTRGMFGSSFGTALQIHNPRATALEGTATFHAGSTTKTIDLAVAPRATLTYEDLAAAFGVTAIGTVDFHFSAGERPVVLSRIFSDRGNGMVFDALPDSHAVRAGETAVLIASPRPEALRFNVGVRALEEGASLSFVVRGANGVVRASGTRELAANTLDQRSAADFTGIALQGSDSIAITVTRGRAFVYGSTTDNITQDPALQFGAFAK